MVKVVIGATKGKLTGKGGRVMVGDDSTGTNASGG